jgi:hypothetical protein
MAGKWNIGSLNVTGQAMFGDNNQMHVNLADLNVTDQAAVKAALSHISNGIEGAAQQGSTALSAEQKAHAQQAVQDVVGELKKPRESQDAGFLKKCLDEVMRVAAAVPGVINAAVQLKGVLGL